MDIQKLKEIQIIYRNAFRRGDNDTCIRLSREYPEKLMWIDFNKNEQFFGDNFGDTIDYIYVKELLRFIEMFNNDPYKLISEDIFNELKKYDKYDIVKVYRDKKRFPYYIYGFCKMKKVEF